MEEIKASALEIEAKVRERETLEAKHADKVQVSPCVRFGWLVPLRKWLPNPMHVRLVERVR